MSELSVEDISSMSSAADTIIDCEVGQDLKRSVAGVHDVLTNGSLPFHIFLDT
jgi:hypothetical protein